MSKYHILVVDDQVEVHGFIEKVLEKNPFTISSAYNGKDAMIKCVEHSYDIILMDHEMPIMNGFEASMWIKKQNPTIPIILMTAYAKYLRNEYRILPLIDYIIEKPLSKEELPRIIYKNLNKWEKYYLTFLS